MFYVYILSSRNGLLSAGVTRHIAQHMQQHQLSAEADGILKHQFDHLLLLEPFRQSAAAMARQQHLNHCTLTEKLELIRAANPKLNDLTQTLPS